MNAAACFLIMSEVKEDAVMVLQRQRGIVGGVGAVQTLSSLIHLLTGVQLEAEGEAEAGNVVGSVEDRDTNCPVPSSEERQPDC